MARRAADLRRCRLCGDRHLGAHRSDVMHIAGRLPVARTTGEKNATARLDCPELVFPARELPRRPASARARYVCGPGVVAPLGVASQLAADDAPRVSLAGRIAKTPGQEGLPREPVPRS